MNERRKQVNNPKNMEGKMKNETWLDGKGKKITEEYIIINKTAIQKRIEELEKWNYMQEGATTYRSSTHLESSRRQIIQNKEVILELKQILSQSTPLIPQLQKTWNTAYTDALSIDEETYKPFFFEDYISNLKLDI